MSSPVLGLSLEFSLEEANITSCVAYQRSLIKKFTSERMFPLTSKCLWATILLTF